MFNAFLTTMATIHHTLSHNAPAFCLRGRKPQKSATKRLIDIWRNFKGSGWRVHFCRGYTGAWKAVALNMRQIILFETHAF